jgi:hypothetical protein
VVAPGVVAPGVVAAPGVLAVLLPPAVVLAAVLLCTFDGTRTDMSNRSKTKTASGP